MSKSALCLKVGYNNVYKLKIVKVLCMIIIIIISLIYVLCINIADEKSFLLLSFTMGMLFIIITPFPHVIDESDHFFRSFMISQGDFLDNTIDGKIGGFVSNNYSDCGINDHLKLDMRSFFSEGKRWLQRFSEEKIYKENPYMSSVLPLNHSIAALGVFLGRILKLPAVFVIILGRLVNYLFYTVMSYYAIKKSKYYKTLFFIASTLPMSLFLAGSFSQDSVLISSCMLFTSICLRHYCEPDINMTKKEKIALIITCVIIASVKYMVYVPVLLCFFLINKQKFGKKEYITEWILAIISIITLAILQIWLLKKFPFVEDRNGDVDVIRQLNYMISNPLTSLRNFLNYFMSSLVNHIIENTQGYRLQDPLIPFIGIFAIFGSCLEQKKAQIDEINKKKLSTLFVFIFIVSYLLSIIALYLGFTPVGSFSVQGLQSRYLIPIVIFVMLPISFIQVDNRIKNYSKYVAAFAGLGVLDMLMSIVLGVWG